MHFFSIASMINKITKRSPKNIETIQSNPQNSSLDNSTYINGFGNNVENVEKNLDSKTSMMNPSFDLKKNDHFEIEENKPKVEVKGKISD